MKVQGSMELPRTSYVQQAPLAPSPERGQAGRVTAAEDSLQEAKSWEEQTELEVQEAVEALNDAVEYINRGLRFTIHEDTQRMMVRVVNIETNEVIEEIPPEEVLDTVARIREMIGLLIDKWA